MLFVYCGYYLEVNPAKGDDSLISGYCKELDFNISKIGIDSVISSFKTFVDTLIVNAEEDYRYHEYKGYTLKGKTVLTKSGDFIKVLADCKKIGYTQIFQHTDYEWIITDFKKAVDFYISKKTKKIKVNSELDLYISNLNLLEFEERHYNYSEFKVNERLHEIWTWYKNLGLSKEDVKSHYKARYKK